MKTRKTITAITLGALALAALPAMASAATWTRANTTPMNLPVNPAPTTPYPSTIAVEDLPGTVTKIVPTFVGFRHNGPGDVDALLAGPNGQNVMLMSDVGCDNIINPSRDFSFDDGAATGLGADISCPGGTYKPTNGAPVNDPMPAPAPAGPFGLSIAALTGGSANGNWNLYVVDDGAISTGDILGGWRLAITTDASDSCGGKQATVLGTDGDDTLRGTKGKDVIAGFKGRDEISGLKGDDVLCGGPGKDILIGGAGKDRLLGQGAKDRCVGGAAKDVARSCEKQKSV
jgi:Ca2+-binding RTX toxin-like protein